MDPLDVEIGQLVIYRMPADVTQADAMRKAIVIDTDAEAAPYGPPGVQLVHIGAHGVVAKTEGFVLHESSGAGVGYTGKHGRWCTLHEAGCVLEQCMSDPDGIDVGDAVMLFKHGNHVGPALVSHVVMEGEEYPDLPDRKLWLQGVVDGVFLAMESIPHWVDVSDAPDVVLCWSTFLEWSQMQAALVP